MTRTRVFAVFLHAALPAAWIAFIATTGLAAERLETAVTEGGLARLAWAGADLLKDGRPQVKRVTFEHETLDAQNLNIYTFEQEFTWLLLESHVWRDILRRHPDVLLIPELPTWAPAEWAYTASYLQPPYTPAATPAYLRELLPGSFSVCQSVNLSPADWSKRRAEMLDGVRHGDSMFFRGWFDDDYNAKIKQMYEESNP